MLSQNNAHPSSSKSMMPYDDDTLLANAHYIMKFPASQDETPKRLRLHSVIAAIKDDNGLKECLKSDIQVVFILYGDICNIADIVDTVKQAGKMALVHLDLINGLSAKDVAVDFIKKYTKADGIISTKPALIKHAGEIGLTSVLRLFVIDSMAYENIQKHVKGARPDVIEVLPALMPKVVKRVCRISQIPVIAGGLVSDKEDVMSLLQAGVVSVSSTNKEIWFM